MRQRIIIVST